MDELNPSQSELEVAHLPRKILRRRNTVEKAESNSLRTNDKPPEAVVDSCGALEHENVKEFLMEKSYHETATRGGHERGVPNVATSRGCRDVVNNSRNTARRILPSIPSTADGRRRILPQITVSVLDENICLDSDSESDEDPALLTTDRCFEPQNILNEEVQPAPVLQALCESVRKYQVKKAFVEKVPLASNKTEDVFRTELESINEEESDQDEPTEADVESVTNRNRTFATPPTNEQRRTENESGIMGDLGEEHLFVVRGEMAGILSRMKTVERDFTAIRAKMENLRVAMHRSKEN